MIDSEELPTTSQRLDDGHWYIVNEEELLPEGMSVTDDMLVLVDEGFAIATLNSAVPLVLGELAVPAERFPERSHIVDTLPKQPRQNNALYKGAYTVICRQFICEVLQLSYWSTGITGIKKAIARIATADSDTSGILYLRLKDGQSPDQSVLPVR